MNLMFVNKQEIKVSFMAVKHLRQRESINKYYCHIIIITINDRSEVSINGENRKYCTNIISYVCYI